MTDHGHIKIAQVFAHLPLTPLWEGVTDAYLGGWTDWVDPDGPAWPNYSQINAFVRVVFKHATVGKFISLRAFVDDSSNRRFAITPHKLNGNLDTLVDQAYRLAELAACASDKVVFCPPVATFTSSKQAKEADLAEGLVLSIECDAQPQAARKKLEKLLGPPTLVVASGGVWRNPETNELEPKLHLYWLLKVPARRQDELAKLKETRKLATQIAGGDTSNVTIVHPIRWPGSVHRKGEPKLCRIVECNLDAEIDLDTALDILRASTGNDRPRDKSGNGAAPIKVADAFKHLDPHHTLTDSIVVNELPLRPFGPIKAECGWLRHVHDTGGADQSERLWWDALRCCPFLEDGEKLIHEFSEKYAKVGKDGTRYGYNFAETEAKFDHVRKDQKDKDLGYPKCQTICDDGSEQCKTCPHLAKGKSPLNLAPLTPDTAPAYSEEALALAFAERHIDTLRYVAKWGQWFIWDGTCWRKDETRQVFTYARELCREFALLHNKSSERKRIASAKTRAAVVSLAGEDRRLAATTAQWDADPWLLNTPDGVVDLHTGKLRAHQSTDYMTKQTAVAPAKTGSCSRWMMFLQEITNGDRDRQRYLQRVSGYCLTGVTTEQQLFFLYGSGNNGKGVFTRTSSAILKDYHESASIETFTITRSERHPTELAKLCGARLVTTAETEEGRRWSEARIKEITGGDPIDARFMRQDFFTYFPQFKLMPSGNHMPTLRTVNKAITRRFNRIPFTVTIPDERVNKDLTDELKAEWPGILAWAIEGCLEWQRIGLYPPKAVTDATDSYLESEDVLGEWIDECCIRDANAWESSTALFNSWKGWAVGREQWIGSENTFSAKLEDRGEFKRRRNKEQTKRGFVGLRLKTTAEKGAAEKGAAESAAKIVKLIS
jgi:putative DNA primase/helicase